MRGYGDGSSDAGKRDSNGRSRSASTTASGSTGAAIAVAPHSPSAFVIATVTNGIPRSSAAIADAYSHGSRRIRSGRRSSHAASIAGRTASAQMRPNHSRSMNSLCSSREQVR